MRCPKCGSRNTKVTDTRTRENIVHRKRECLDCGKTFPTIEAHMKNPREELSCLRKEKKGGGKEGTP